MSKVKIQGNASGTGVLTVTAPNTDTDRVITLPDADVTLGTDATKLPLAGGTMTGNVTHSSGYLDMGSGHIYLADNAQVKLGTSEDLQIYHDGTDSYIHDVGTGNLELRTNGVQIGIMAINGSEYMGKFVQGNQVELYYNNSKKFETTATGIAVTGGVAIGGTAAANTLDDYEEGTFTPVFKDTSNVTVTGSVYNASYTKIGQMVFISVYYSPSNVQNGYISNMSLPFTASGNQHRSAGSLWTYNGPIAEKSNQWLVQTNTSHASFWKLRDNLTSTTMQWDNGTEIVLSIAYFTSQ